MDGVLAEVRDLASRGVVEVEFLGQTVNAYRDAQGHTLADLLPATAAVEGIHRIRFTTSHPAQMTVPLMDAMAAARPELCPYLHLPVQSGSSSVLHRMRRGYDREGYLRKIAALRARIPEMTFGTDLIVGFPGETDQDFEGTLSLMKEVQFDQVYSFTYSPRPGTAALDLGDEVGERTKLERLQRLQACQREIQEKRNRSLIGREVEVLVEGMSKRDAGKWSGRTPENRVVHFTGDFRPGRLERLVIRETTAYSLRGEPLTGCA
jgi:tRNA-2-methylthio-N6-dimethylallyladenosine synthase